MTTKPIIPLDRVRGMFMGAFCGDSLGGSTRIPMQRQCTIYGNFGT